MMSPMRSITSLAVLSLMPLLATAQQIHDGQDGDDRTTTLTVGNYNDRSLLPTGQFITPTAATGATIQVLPTGLRADGNADASEAVNTALSPDGKNLLVLTSGWNRNNDQPDGTPITFPTLNPATGMPAGTTGNDEWVFVFHLDHHGVATKQQQISLPNTFSGLTWAPDSSRFYVSAGDDDRIYVFKHTRLEY